MAEIKLVLNHQQALNGLHHWNLHGTVKLTLKKVILISKKKLFKKQTCDPVFPNLLQTYRPKNPVAPKTVATVPLNELRPPVPLFNEAGLRVLIVFGESVE